MPRDLRPSESRVTENGHARFDGEALETDARHGRATYAPVGNDGKLLARLRSQRTAAVPYPIGERDILPGQASTSKSFGADVRDPS
jgi:hypothetical protein